MESLSGQGRGSTGWGRGVCWIPLSIRFSAFFQDIVVILPEQYAFVVAAQSKIEKKNGKKN